MRPSIYLEDEVLAALGKVAWTAMNLEDWTDAVCSATRPANLEKCFTIGSKIDAAIRAVKSREPSATNTRLVEWLRNSQAALRVRNQLLHGVPAQSIDGRQGVAYLNRDKTTGNYKPAIEYSITVLELNRISERFEAVLRGFATALTDANS